MTQLLTDGPLDLDARHRWTGGDGVAVLMHDILTDDGTAFRRPRIHFTAMPGFRALPEAADNRIQRAGRLGEGPLPGNIGGKTFTVKGTIEADTHEELRRTERSMARAFAERSRLGTWRVEPRADNGGITTDHWEARGRVLAYDPDEAPTLDPGIRKSYRLGFSFGIRLYDPRFLWTDVQDSGAAAAGDIDVENEGDAPADPSLVVGVGIGETRLTVTNETTGRGLTVYLPALIAAGTVTFNFALRTITFLTSGGTPGVDDVDIAANLGSSNWWDQAEPGLAPGENTLSSDGQVGTPTMTVYWRHTSW